MALRRELSVPGRPPQKRKLDALTREATIQTDAFLRRPPDDDRNLNDHENGEGTEVAGERRSARGSQ
jgi:hypothetical protein